MGGWVGRTSKVSKKKKPQTKGKESTSEKKDGSGESSSSISSTSGNKQEHSRHSIWSIIVCVCVAFKVSDLPMTEAIQEERD